MSGDRKPYLDADDKYAVGHCETWGHDRSTLCDRLHAAAENALLEAAALEAEIGARILQLAKGLGKNDSGQPLTDVIQRVHALRELRARFSSPPRHRSALQGSPTVPASSPMHALRRRALDPEHAGPCGACSDDMTTKEPNA